MHIPKYFNDTINFSFFSAKKKKQKTERLPNCESYESYGITIAVQLVNDTCHK